MAHTLLATCPCGDSIEVYGHDESARNAIRAWKAEHAPHRVKTQAPEYTVDFTKAGADRFVPKGQA